MRVEPALVDVVEEGEEAVVLLLRHGVVLVVVAARALHGQAEEGRAEGVHAVGHVLDAVLLLGAAALVGLAVQAVEGRGQALLAGRLGQEVPRQLPGHEVVPGEVVVEGADDPVAPGPDAALDVALVAVGVRVARDVEPLAGHALAVAGRSQQPVDGALVGARSLVGQEGVELLGGRRQARQVEADAPQPGRALGLWGGRESLGLEACEDEAIEVVAGPVAGLDRR